MEYERGGSIYIFPLASYMLQRIENSNWIINYFAQKSFIVYREKSVPKGINNKIEL